MADAKVIEQRLTGLVGDHPLRDLKGAGVLVTAKLIGEAGDVRRFRSADAFAMLAGVAPIPASSGQTQRMRLNRGGNRQLNRALHTIALAQAWHHPPAKDYIARKSRGQDLARGSPVTQALLARVVFRLLGACRSDHDSRRLTDRSLNAGGSTRGARPEHTLGSLVALPGSWILAGTSREEPA